MKNIIKRDEVHEGQNFQLSLYYDIGGIDYFAGASKPRGYYVSVTPMNISVLSNGMVMTEFTAFSGIGMCILRVERKSAKAEKTAILLSEDAFAQLLPRVIEKWRIKNGKKLNKEATERVGCLSGSVS